MVLFFYRFLKALHSHKPILNTQTLYRLVTYIKSSNQFMQIDLSPNSWKKYIFINRWSRADSHRNCSHEVNITKILPRKNWLTENIFLSLSFHLSTDEGVKDLVTNFVCRPKKKFPEWIVESSTRYQSGALLLFLWYVVNSVDNSKQWNCRLSKLQNWKC